MLGDLIPVMAGVAIAGRYLGPEIVTMTWNRRRRQLHWRPSTKA